MKIILLISALFFLSSCNSSNNGSEKKLVDSSQVFNELWEVFDKNYAFFELRDVNWEEEKRNGLKHFSTIKSDAALFDAFCSLLKKFDDSHINLESDELNKDCNAGTLPEFFNEYSTSESFTSFLNARNNSLTKLGIIDLLDTESKLFTYGWDEKKNWGYLRIKRFYGAPLGTIELELDKIFEELETVNQLIVDIRVNPGGNDETALLCAGYFFHQKEIAFIKQFRKGKAHEDFGPLDTTYVIPNKRFPSQTKKIYLLTNGASGSSADVFALVMSYLSNIKVVGKNTEGIFSDMYRDTLSNGWRITLSNERYYSKEMKCFEKIGVPVDIEIGNKKSVSDQGLDAPIESIFQLK